MKPWRADPDSPSDFKRSDAPPLERPSPSAIAAQCGASAAAATLALGFAEACLHIEHRPIPLPFATKFALYNTLPSTVWSTIHPQQIAVASNLPVERLVSPVTVHGAPNLEARHANRFIAIKTLRSLRYDVASYGLLWTAWRWHTACLRDSSVIEQSVALEDPARVPTSSASGHLERVVRLAPSGSSLSKATATKHGDHVRLVPWRAVQRGDAIDWSTLGLEEAATATTSADDDVPEASRPRLQVLELEIDGSHHGASPFLVAKRAAAGANAAVHTVAVVDPTASPEWHSRSNGVDVYFYALSGIIAFLREHVEAEDEVVLVTSLEGEEDGALEHEKTLVHMVQRALTHRHGITCSVGMKHALYDDEEDDDDNASMRSQQTPIYTVVFAPSMENATKQLARIAGLVSVDRTLVVVAESLPSKTRVSKLAAKCAGVLSVADLTDGVLQRVREQLRAGVSPDAIQLSIFEDFGEQSALLARADGASDIAKYI